MCSAVGIARANAVVAAPIAVAIETCDAGSSFRYIAVSEGVCNIISSLARNDNNDDNDHEDDQEGDADAERTADTASAEASFGNLLTVIVNSLVAVHLEGNLFIQTNKYIII